MSTREQFLTKLSGKAVRFTGRGRQLGYPTANITTNTGLADGIYFGYGDLDKYTDCPTLIFIGAPKGFGDFRQRIEAHLLDIPDKDYYGQTLTLRIYKYHRPSYDFVNEAQLVKAMKEDEIAARKWFKPNGAKKDK